MRCRPSTRMSATVNGSKFWAWTGAARAAASARLRRRRRAIGRVIINPWVFAGGTLPAVRVGSGTEPEYVVVEGQPHQPGQQDQTDILPCRQRTVADRTAFDQLDKVIQQVPAIQYRDRQQVHDAQAEREDRQEIEEPGRPQAGAAIGNAGDGDRTG